MSKIPTAVHTCDILPDLPTNLVRTQVKVDPFHWAAQLVDTVKKATAIIVRTQRLLPDHLLERALSKNWAVARFSVDGGPLRSLWAVSGEQYVTQTIKRVLRDIGLDVAGDARGRYIVTNAQAAADAEVQILEEIAARGLRPGQRITIELFTERAPCPSCGGSGHLFDGVIGQFIAEMQGLGVSVEIHILYLRELGQN